MENFYRSLHDRFLIGAENIAHKLEKQVELFQDVYQLYTFVQSQTLDLFVQSNNKFEYDTLWRYPLQSKLKEIIRDDKLRLVKKLLSI